MFFASLFISIAGMLGVSSAVPLDTRDVFVRPILYPHAGTVWTVGHYRNVTWSLADELKNITNSERRLLLAKNGLAFVNGTGGYMDPLASNFSIRAGHVEIKVPDVVTGHNYQLVLFGDTGNFSQNLTIKAKSD